MGRWELTALGNQVFRNTCSPGHDDDFGGRDSKIERLRQRAIHCTERDHSGVFISFLFFGYTSHNDP